MSVPGIGPISAMAIQAFAPLMESFRRGRDFSAWLGLVPRQHTTGGKPKLGKISKMGQRDLRRLLITGAMTVVRWAVRRGVTTDPWLAGMLARKPRMLVAVALRPDTRQHLTACTEPTKNCLHQRGRPHTFVQAVGAEIAEDSERPLREDIGGRRAPTTPVGRTIPRPRRTLTPPYRPNRTFTGHERSGDAWGSPKNHSEDIPKRVLEEIA